MELNGNKLSGGHLVAGLAAGFDVLGVVPAAVDVSVLIEVNEIHQQLVTGSALEALRMPAGAVTRSGCKHRYVTAADLPATLINTQRGREI